MNDIERLKADLSCDLETGKQLAVALRSLAGMYDLHGSTEVVAHELRLSIDGDVDPVITKAMVERLRRSMYRLLLTVQIDWLESKHGN